MAPPLPDHDVAGILPPYVGPKAGAASPGARAPWHATVVDLSQRFATSPRRVEILAGFLEHREALRGLGIVDGFQWIDGSFLDFMRREPNDIDLVTFFHPPPGYDPDAVVLSHPDVVRPRRAKVRYHVDPYFVRLDKRPLELVRDAVYWSSLFSHNRDDVWRGIIQVPLSADPTEDLAAQTVAFLKALDL